MIVSEQSAAAEKRISELEAKVLELDQEKAELTQTLELVMAK